jgi:hypothetical protein
MIPTNWPNSLLAIEQNSDWAAAINLLEKAVDPPRDLYLRVIFLLLYFIIEEQYTEAEYEVISQKIKKFFDAANNKFSNQPKFLFFAGIMIYMGEWYFGMEDVEPGALMLKKAMILEPENALYSWGYYSRIDQRLSINTQLKIKLIEEILSQPTRYIDWLKSKGLLGEYIITTLENSYKNLISI